MSIQVITFPPVLSQFFLTVDRISKESFQRRGYLCEVNDKHLSNGSSKGTSTLCFSAGRNQTVNQLTFQNTQRLQYQNANCSFIIHSYLL